MDEQTADVSGEPAKDKRRQKQWIGQLHGEKTD
jgi:hypothetical protein